MYLATEASEIWIPSLRSSLRILGAPQIELFRLRVRINSRVSFATLGLPACPCRTFQVQLCSAKTLSRSVMRSEEHTSELQSRLHLVCRLLLEKKKTPMLSNLAHSKHHT